MIDILKIIYIILCIIISFDFMFLKLKDITWFNFIIGIIFFPTIIFAIIFNIIIYIIELIMKLKIWEKLNKPIIKNKWKK